MKNKFARLLVSLSAVLISAQSYALVEVRGGYSLLKPKDNNYDGQFAGFHGDVIVDPPLFPVGFGIRYETLTSSFSNSIQGSADYTLNRTSAVINSRFIDTLVWLGGIATVSLSNELTIKDKASGSKVKYKDGTTYSLGLEGGTTLGVLLIGAEVGYMFGTLKSNGYSDAKLDGTYAKVHVGLGF